MSLKMALKKNNIAIAGSSDEYEEAVAEISETQPTLVLLDIQLQSKRDGVDVAHFLNTQQIPYLFLTSQTDPVTLSRVKETNPLGYIVKPFTEAGLLSNITLAWHTITQDDDTISFKAEGKKYTINQSCIQYLRAFDNYCYIVTSTKEYLVPHTLKSISELLNQTFFFQCHRSYWINLRKVVAVGTEIVQVDSVEIPLGYSRKKKLTARMTDASALG